MIVNNETADKKSRYEQLRDEGERARDLADALQILEWALLRLKEVEEQIAIFNTKSAAADEKNWKRSGLRLLSEYGIDLRTINDRPGYWP